VDGWTIVGIVWLVAVILILVIGALVVRFGIGKKYGKK
jgi:hypothetical protein